MNRPGPVPRTRAAIAHDLRAPLNGIVGFAELIAFGMAPNAAKQAEYAGEILVSARELLRLIDEWAAEPGPGGEGETHSASNR